MKSKICIFFTVFSLLILSGCERGKNKLEFGSFLEKDMIGKYKVNSSEITIEIFINEEGNRDFKVVDDKSWSEVNNYCLNEKWFAYFENEERVWIYDGIKDISLVVNSKQVDAIYGITNSCGGGVCVGWASKMPKKVMNRLPESLQQKIKTALDAKS